MKGKLVLVAFPFDDLTTTKVRPAVCMTELLGPYHHVILAFITSQIPSDLMDSDLVLDSSHTDFASTGLRTSSTVRLHRMISVTSSLIRREIGVLSPAMQNELANRLRRLFAL